MSGASTFYSRHFFRHSWVLAATLLLTAGYSGVYRWLRDDDTSRLWVAIFVGALAAYFVVALLRRRVPVLIIGERRIEFSSPFPFRRRGSVSLSEVRSATVERNRLLLDTLVGAFEISLWELTPVDQSAALEEIQARISGQASR